MTFNCENRISIPFFFEPNYDFILNPSLLKIKKKPLYKINNYEKLLSGLELLNNSIKIGTNQVEHILFYNFIIEYHILTASSGVLSSVGGR